MYKLFKQAVWDENGRQLVNAVYTDDSTQPRQPHTEPCYDTDTNVKWWQCSTDEFKCDGRKYIGFLLHQHLNNGEWYPAKRNIVFDKNGTVVLLCDDETCWSIDSVYGSIENYLKTQQTELEF
jgi:hypothetical protein